MEWDFRLWAFIVCVWICWRPRAFRGGYRPAPNTRQAFIVRFFFLETKQKQKKYSRRARLHWFINRVSDVLQVYAACGGVRGGESESRHWRTYIHFAFVYVIAADWLDLCAWISVLPKVHKHFSALLLLPTCSPNDFRRMYLHIIHTQTTLLCFILYVELEHYWFQWRWHSQPDVHIMEASPSTFVHDEGRVASRETWYYLISTKGLLTKRKMLIEILWAHTTHGIVGSHTMKELIFFFFTWRDSQRRIRVEMEMNLLINEAPKSG